MPDYTWGWFAVCSHGVVKDPGDKMVTVNGIVALPAPKKPIDTQLSRLSWEAELPLFFSPISISFLQPGVAGVV
jgi:hypothetical protein